MLIPNHVVEHMVAIGSIVAAAARHVFLSILRIFDHVNENVSIVSLPFNLFLLEQRERVSFRKSSMKDISNCVIGSLI